MHGGSLPSWTWDRHLQPPDACSSIQTQRLTSSHTLTGLFGRPGGPAVLRTWSGIYKKIFVNGGRSAVRNGPVHAAASHPAIFGRRAWKRKPGQINVRRSMPQMPGPDFYCLIQSANTSTTLNHSTRDKLTAPSLSTTEMKSLRTLMIESASKTLSHISFQAACWSTGCKAVKFPVKNVTFFFL